MFVGTLPKYIRIRSSLPRLWHTQCILRSRPDEWHNNGRWSRRPLPSIYILVAFCRSKWILVLRCFSCDAALYAFPYVRWYFDGAATAIGVATQQRPNNQLFEKWNETENTENNKNKTVNLRHNSDGLLDENVRLASALVPTFMFITIIYDLSLDLDFI